MSRDDRWMVVSSTSHAATSLQTNPALSWLTPKQVTTRSAWSFDCQAGCKTDDFFGSAPGVMALLPSHSCQADLFRGKQC